MVTKLETQILHLIEKYLRKQAITSEKQEYALFATDHPYGPPPYEWIDAKNEWHRCQNKIDRLKEMSVAIERGYEIVKRTNTPKEIKSMSECRRIDAQAPGTLVKCPICGKIFTAAAFLEHASNCIKKVDDEDDEE